MNADELFNEVGTSLIITTVDGESFYLNSLNSLRNRSGWCFVIENTPDFFDDTPPALVRIDKIVSITVPKEEGHPVHLGREELHKLQLALQIIADPSKPVIR